MKVSKIYNASLLAIIARKSEITYGDLKKEYCEPTPSVDNPYGSNPME